MQPHNGEVPDLQNSQCARCAKLLMEYIAAGNEAINTREQIQRAGQAGAAASLSPVLERHLEHRNALRKRLILHQELHRFHSRSNS